MQHPLKTIPAIAARLADDHAYIGWYRRQHGVDLARETAFHTAMDLLAEVPFTDTDTHRQRRRATLLTEWLLGNVAGAASPKQLAVDYRHQCPPRCAR